MKTTTRILKNGKPILKVRENLLRTDMKVHLFSDTTIKKRSTEQLEDYVQYVQEWLEVAAGTQVWQVLEALARSEAELQSRKSKLQRKYIK